jgi:adenylate cyclase
MPAVRRLAAILAADVAGYSRLMGTDEEGTHERLKVHRRELVDPKISAHSGRIVKTTGDGLLAEFPSVVDAVRCAAELQRAVIDREASIPEDRRIRFRVGINLGDVIVEGGDIFGHGVNVAARLEAMSDPGGICISRMVRDQIRDKLPYDFEDLGEQSVKNVARPVRVYALRSEAVAGLPAPSAPATPPIPQPAIAPRLSIVVLPFANLGNDPDQQYFADGITEDLTTDLSRLSDMLVISRNTAFTYQGSQVDTKQIGRELCVRYVLEGSIRRSGNRVRVNAQLIDAEADVHLWAERFDSDTSDLFALQDEITNRIAVALNIDLIAAEAARPTERPDALDYVLRGRGVRLKAPSRENSAEAIGLFEQALTLDQQSVVARSWLAIELTQRVLANMTDTATTDIRRAEVLVDQALASSSRNALAHFAKGQLLRAQNRYDAAIPEYETALALDRSLVRAYAHIAQCKLYNGSIEEVIPLLEQAIRLSPHDPQIFTFYVRIGLVHLLQSRIDKAIIWLGRARSADPEHPNVRAYLASAHALIGQIELAAAELAEARRLSADDRFSNITCLKAAGLTGSGSWGVPQVRELCETTYLVGLRLAGMPEQ